MSSDYRLFFQCLAIAEECNASEQWRLTRFQLERYAAVLAGQLVQEGSPPDEIRRVAILYHSEHPYVLALRDPAQPAHQEAWLRLLRQARAALRREGLLWSSDSAIEEDDLAQIVAVELARALPGYRYRSRFAVWAYRVAVQTMRRHLRDSRRARRAVRPESLDTLSEATIGETPGPDAADHAAAGMLYRDVMAVLTAQPDRRLSYIFHLAAVEDRRMAEIGALVRLHPSRVRHLLRETRQLLRKNPVIRTWETAETPDSHHPGEHTL